MKEETKRLVHWINTILNDFEKVLKETAGPTDAYNRKRKEALKFLDTLPEIEEKLCFGGYIQDKNGVPCCQGDKVNVPFQDFIGTLKWDLPTRRFVVVCDNGTEWSLSSWEFEKVDE